MMMTGKQMRILVGAAIAVIAAGGCHNGEGEDRDGRTDAEDRTEADQRIDADGGIDSEGGVDVEEGFDSEESIEADGAGDAEEDIEGEGDCNAPGPFNIVDQEPPCMLPYPGSLWTRPLPADVMAHLAPRSDEIAQTVLTDRGAVSPEHYGLSILATPSPDDWNSFPRYYGNATDPLYRLDLESCAPDTGIFLRIPNGACFSRSNDHGIFVWDQVSQRTLGIYKWSTDTELCFPPCSGMTEATACPIVHAEGYHCGVSHWTDGPAYADGVDHWGFGPNSLGNAPWTLLVRYRELLEGTILHPLLAVTYCTVGHIFPAVYGTYECSLLDEPEDVRPPTGSLFFLDYSDEEIDAMGLPAWQEPLVRAAARYGVYISDTNAYRGVPVSLRFEGHGAYDQAGITSPIFAWLQDQGVSPWTGSDGGERYPLSFLAGLPDVLNRFHLADECVARGLAGTTGGCP